ncbi:hypothetical protein SAMN06265222_11833 [Neorhodopirellula lusitana]|uniref:Uncharacterized protein n=1 Tax=Neorhodopirellula lusitana TaxID=445327 RepID=A0ABY1QNT5_9BACT|nr:hypothetical protein [Neorhodopirellula lusitana]SMP74776.1 hypothetical protein SAMN06265222_11833 [Neorhodopirellula lusitana]
MRTLLLLGLAIGGAFMAGWFTIERDGDRTRIEINKTEIRSDARQAIDKGRDILDKREQDQLAAQQGGYNANPTSPNTGNWPPQAAPMQNGVQGAGYAGPANYPQNGYPQQQPQYGQQPQNQYGNQPSYNSNYPPPAQSQQAAPRWTEMPPPWQQQTR